MGIFEVWCFLCLVCLVCGQTVQDQLECYRCQNEMDNLDECILTKYTCGITQDACVSYVQWKAKPGWNMHTYGRQYSITKGCDTFEGCKRLGDSLKTHCKRDWYNDWACIECCQGDLCNYYVTLGSSSVRASLLAVIVSTIAVYTLRTVQ